MNLIIQGAVSEKVVSCTIIESLCTADGLEGSHTVYGAEVTFSNGNIRRFEDICTKTILILPLVRRLEGQEVDPVSLSYIIEDYVSETMDNDFIS